MSPKSAIPTQHIRSCRLIVCGAAHVDRTGLLDAPSALGCSNPGRFEETFGGTALNVASVAAGLGAEVELVSLVAQDPALQTRPAALPERVQSLLAVWRTGNAPAQGSRPTLSGPFASCDLPQQAN